MNRSTLALGLAVSLVAAPLGGAVAQMNHMHMQAPSGGDLASLEGAEFEIAFLSQMIAHHRGATAMADWLLEHSTNAEVRRAAEAVQAAQEPEIEMMTRWLETWYDQGMDEGAAAGMKAEMDAMLGEMGAATDPDSGFLTGMTDHHMSAIDMAQLALVKATNPELRTLARDIILTQTAEIYEYQVQLASR